jgi:hypothetical protein
MSASLKDAGGPLTLALYLWLLVFHLGAAMLAYRKTGSAGWAILAFVFAAFYYPYSALSGDAPSAAPAPLIGGMFGSLMKVVGGKSTRRR